MPPLLSDRKRFWDKVDCDGPVYPVLGTRCWLWLVNKDKDGYGQFFFAGHNWKAHRFSWLLKHGRTPDPFICVLHRCDVTSCVNPNHLFLGTVTDNVTDKVQKMRQGVGESIGNAVLTEELVRYARHRYQRGCRVNGIYAIAEELGVNAATVWHVVNGRTWKNVTLANALDELYNEDAGSTHE